MARTFILAWVIGVLGLVMIGSRIWASSNCSDKRCGLRSNLMAGPLEASVKNNSATHPGEFCRT